MSAVLLDTERAHLVHDYLRLIDVISKDMSISATAVRFDEHTMWVELTDGRTLGVPLAWFQSLLHATPDSASVSN